jgi:hypothetical protein
MLTPILMVLTSIPVDIRIGEVTKQSRVSSEVSRALVSMNTGKLEELHAVERADGMGYRQIVGKFPWFPEFDDVVGSPDIIASAAAAFIRENSEVFGVSVEFADSWLGRPEISVRDTDWSIQFDQLRNGVPLDGAHLKMTILMDGTIVSVNGQIENIADAERPPILTPELAITSLERLGINGFPTVATRFTSRFSEETRDAPANTMTFLATDGQEGWFYLAVDRFSGGYVWHFTTTDGKHMVVDDATGAITVYETNLEYKTIDCNVKHLEFTRVGALATSTDPDGAVAHQIPCGGDEVFGTCYYQLRRSEVTNGLDRVQDDIGAEPQVAQACSSSSIPQFTQGVGGSNFNEQSAFFFGTQARKIANQNMYSKVAPSSPTNVEYWTDYQSSVTRYEPFWHDIYIAPVSTQRISSLVHEYGHHVVTTYGVTADQPCVNDVNEYASVHETLAEVFLQLYLADDDLVNFSYIGDPGDGATDSHRFGAGFVDDSNDCNLVDEHNEGLGFTMAAWEVLHNKSCPSGCTTSGMDNDLWTDTSDEEVVAARFGDAFAYALDAVSADTTHEDILSMMSARFTQKYGAPAATRIMAIFQHHGR